MLTVNKLISGGHGLAPVLLKRAATVVLDWETRRSGRFDTEDSQGRAIGVSLPQGAVIHGGDVLVADDGSLIKVISQPQAVLVVRACARHGSPRDLGRLAYELGTNHVTLEVQDDLLQLLPDAALADRLRRMHLTVTEELAPFEPEGHADISSDPRGSAKHGHDPAHDHGHCGHAHGGHDHCSHDH